MEKDKGQQQQCSTHSAPYLFYCFDDKEFLCDVCFKGHRKHNIEIKADLEQKEQSFKFLTSSDSTKVLDKYAIIKEKLIAARDVIDAEIESISSSIAKLQNQDALSFKLITSSVFHLSYEDYNKIENLTDKQSDLEVLSKKVQSILQDLPTKANVTCKEMPDNFHWLQSSVSIKESSPFHVGFPPEILLNKNPGEYYLSEGAKNHLIVFDLGSCYYVKEFKISVANYECSLKNFTVCAATETRYGEKKAFSCPRFTGGTQWSVFELNQYGRYLRFDLIDNWGQGGGAYILINKIMFNASNSVEF